MEFTRAMKNYKTQGKPLGSGCFGVAFRATKVFNGAEVCLKICNELEDEAERIQFEKNSTSPAI
jgi:hypothetical protein